MNKLIFRKLSFDILAFFLLSSIAITLIVWVIQGVNLLDIISEQGHGINVYLLYSLLNVPKIFSKLIIFTYFLTLFIVISRYEENNEILIFWTNGIKKISFINFIGKISFFFVLLQLTFNLFIVPYTQNLSQEYLKNSSIEFFPKLIQEKKFSNVMKNLTIFVEEYNDNGILKGIYIKEKLENNESKIIVASEGKIIKNSKMFSFKLSNGQITNLNKKGSFNLGFKETTYDLSEINSKTRKEKKLDEAESIFLINCLQSNLIKRKSEILRCGKKNYSFELKSIYEEIFKRVINPFYLIILSLVSSLLILKPKYGYKTNYLKLFLFMNGFLIIIFSELSYKFITLSNGLELIFLIMPIFFVILFYTYILFKTKFDLKYL